MQIDIQPTHLENDRVKLVPLQETDFEALYAVAADPLIWEQHPNPDRYKREVFLNFFKGAMESRGAFLIKNAQTEEVIGCSRFYGFDQDTDSMHIGYTFFSRSCWGKSYNAEVKRLMLDYAFGYVSNIIFHVGSDNKRSRKAIEKLGSEPIEEKTVAYYGEEPRMNCIYRLSKKQFQENDKTSSREIQSSGNIPHQ